MEKSRPEIPKSIRPFISSTFLDFQEERGHLQRYVFPKLNSICQARGTYFAPVDLRWGINDEQAQSGNAVALCLEYVNRCSPFFICLLGERYGTHRPADAKLLPSSLDKLPKNVSWLDRNYLVAASKGYDWVLQEAYQHCSVTELEIIQAAFLNDNKLCRFYIRDVKHTEDKFLGLPESVRQKELKVGDYEA
ncbi:tetratricopeptide repeat protein 41-like [Diadema setosum]|uniref:tetratricopeptide repeat protein 41-like n=1 Tax=Diadema setosum TaxID=31175 RepID=UPI003B3AE9CE